MNTQTFKLHFTWHGVAERSAAVTLSAAVNHRPALLAVGWPMGDHTTQVALSIPPNMHDPRV